MCEMCEAKTGEKARRELLARIARHDYSMISVREQWARDHSWVAPGFVYTVGLYGFHRVPELIVVGAPRRNAVELIERYAAQVKLGRRFEAGGPYPDFVPGYGVMLEVVSPALYPQWFSRAFDFYPGGDFMAYQLLWPDRDRVWPWEPRWDGVHIPQPVLTGSGRPESWPVPAAG